MMYRFIGLAFGVAVLVLSLAEVTPAAQQAAPAGGKAIPRTADGKPDLSGTWVPRPEENPILRTAAGASRPMAKALELTEWSKDKFNWNQEPSPARGGGDTPIGEEAVVGGADPRMRARRDQDPFLNCYPLGVVRLGPHLNANLAGGRGVGIIQTAGRTALVYELRNSIRYIYTDGRKHPEILELTWNGHSIGRWDGDTFVVDTVGIRDEGWLDTSGTEHSAELHIVERFRRVDAETLEYQRTLTDPVAFVGSYTQDVVVLKLDPNYGFNDQKGSDDCSQYMTKKVGFGKGVGGVMGIFDHP